MNKINKSWAVGYSYLNIKNCIYIICSYDTDGKSFVLQMRKPTQPERPVSEYTEQQYDNFIGIDPGIRALITSYDTNDKVIQVSTKEYRHKSKMIYACKKRVGWYKIWQHYDDWKLIPTIKTSKTSVMKEYFKYVFPRMRTFTEFHTEKGFRNLNFTSYCRSKATLAKICDVYVCHKKYNKKMVFQSIP